MIFLMLVVLLLADVGTLVGLAVHVRAQSRSTRTRWLLTMLSTPILALELAEIWILTGGPGRSELSVFAVVFGVSLVLKACLLIVAWLQPSSGPVHRGRALGALAAAALACLALVLVLKHTRRRTPAHGQRIDGPVRPPFEEESDASDAGASP